MVILRVRGADGRVQSIPAIRGDDGNEMVLRFSAYADGTDMSETWDADRHYMGIAFVPRTGAVDLASPASYQWLKLGALAPGHYAEDGSEDKYIFYVGNGVDEAHRSNALTLDEDGNMVVGGELTFGEDGYKPREALSEEVERLDGRVDGALEKMARIAVGETTGTRYANTVHLPLDFPPKLLVLTYTYRGYDGFAYNSDSVLRTAIVTKTDTFLLLPLPDGSVYLRENKRGGDSEGAFRGMIAQSCEVKEGKVVITVACTSVYPMDGRSEQITSGYDENYFLKEDEKLNTVEGAKFEYYAIG